MATAGPNSAGTGADDASTGTVAWTNPGNITASDGVYAQYAYGGSPPVDVAIKLIIGGTISGTSAAAVAWTGTLAYASYGGSSSLWGLTPSAADVNSSTFGVAFSATSSHWLKATNFGFSIPTGATINGIQAEVQKFNIGGAQQTQKVDHIRITVTYTAATGTTYTVSESAFADDAHLGGLAVGMPVSEASAATETPIGSAAWELAEDEVTTTLATLAAGWLADDAGTALATLDPLALYLLTVEAWTADDPAAFNTAWTLVDSTAETDAADHYDLLTPLEESAGWDDPLAYVPLLLLTEAGAATEAPEWSAWSLTAIDGVSLDADSATLAATLAAADAPPGLDLSGFVTPVLLVGDLASADSSALLTPLLVAADGWGLIDPATLVSGLVLLDTPLGTEVLTSAAGLNPAESATGGERITTAAVWIAGDSTRPTEALTTAVVGLVTETAIIRELSPTLAALFLPSEVVTGADGQALAATLRPADATGGASEALTGAATLQPAEWPAWSERLIVAAAWTGTDAAAPVESMRSAAAWPMGEGWIGGEIGVFTALWPLSEWWVPRETPAVLVSLTCVEVGSTSEPATLAARLNPSDLAGPIESLTADAVLSPRESVPWSDQPELAAAGVLTDAVSEGAAVLLAVVLPAAESFASGADLGFASKWNVAEPTGAADIPLFASIIISAEIYLGSDALRDAAGWTLAETPFASEGDFGFVSKWGPAEVLTGGEAFARTESYPVREAVAWGEPLAAAAAWEANEAPIARDATPLLTTVWPLGEVAAGGDMLTGPAAWSIRESGPVQEVPGLSQAWTVADAASQGGVGPSLSHLLSTADAITGAELARSGAVLTTSEAAGATTVTSSDARWYTGDAWSALDRSVVAWFAILPDGGGTIEAAQASSRFAVSEAVSAPDDLTASAWWLPIESFVAADVPDPTGLPPTRQDTDLHSRVVITPGAPAAPRAVVSPNAPSGRIAPAAGQPDPSRTTVT